MRRYERALLWSAILVLSGWGLGQAAAGGPKPTSAALSSSVSAHSDRLRLLENLQVFQIGASPVYDGLVKAAGNWEAAASSDSANAAAFREIARLLRDAAKPLEERAAKERAAQAPKGPKDN